MNFKHVWYVGAVKVGKRLCLTRNKYIDILIAEISRSWGGHLRLKALM